MRFICAMAVGLGVLASAGPALAAEPETRTSFDEYMATGVPRVAFNAGGGAAIPISDAGGRFKDGGGAQMGVTYKFTKQLGLQAEYSYTRYGIQSDVLESQGVQGDHILQYGDLNAVYDVLPARPLSVYVLGGPGVYFRSVKISEFVGTGFAPYCDPWLFFCFNTPVSVEQVIGSRSRTDFGLNAGVGVSLKLFGGPMKLYLEGRYHYVFGGSIDTPSGPRKATGQYLPIVLGFRL
ncbi:outer membrane beta-barrel protein [Vitiosangium sp. GDMCC 1.1324]|uniref:outer membrane beta-barrel protein n=1 Tax=Vitiosangium sp. (strain GDMCC 1.1324) TaxID=2138576 RepID=UPI00130D8276|nr:outer membrane beta-barrel protein [Vitiosangium sp. GDMCC 1.1324]